MPSHGDTSPAKKPMRRIVVSLLKGGVAKSETSVSLAHGLALKGYRVLLVDTDVQAQCSDMLGIHPNHGLAELIAGLGSPLDLLVPARENLWLLAGGNGLAGVKMEIARREMSPESVLAEALENYEGGFDYMIVDTAPGWDTLLVNALYCCREVLSPVSMEPVALSGLARFQERLAVIQKYNSQLEWRWIVPTFVDGRVKKSAEIMAQLQETYGPMLTPEIKYSVKLSEAPAFGKTIYEHDPKGIGAKGYWNLVEHVLADQPARAAKPLVALAPPDRPAFTPPPMEQIPEPQPIPAPQAVPVTAAPQPEASQPVMPQPVVPQPVAMEPAPAPVASDPEPEPMAAPLAPAAVELEPEPEPMAAPLAADAPSAPPAPEIPPARVAPLSERVAARAADPGDWEDELPPPTVDGPGMAPARTITFGARRALRERLLRAQERMAGQREDYREIRERLRHGGA